MLMRGTKAGLVFLAFLWLAIVAASWAESAEVAPAGFEPSTAATSSSDEYDFKWLDPEKKIYVLQNRKYTKANRGMFSLLYGPGISNAYRNTFGLSGRASYYFSEWLGLEAFYSGFSNSENSTFEALKSTNTQITPVIREVRSQMGIMLQYVPWYAKINFFNAILYFDWYLSGGVGSSRTALDSRAFAGLGPSSPASYTESTLTTYYLGTGQIYHVNDWLSVRLEFQASLFRAPIGGTTGRDIWFSNDVFGLGLGVKL